MPVSNNTRSNKGKTPTKDLSLVALSLTSPQPSSGRRKTAIKSKSTNRGSVKKGPKSNVVASRKARQHANLSASKVARKKLQDKSRSTPIKAEVLVSKPVLTNNKQEASDITTDVLSNTKHIAPVSCNDVDNQMFNFYNYRETLSQYLELFLARRSMDQDRKKQPELWLFLKAEGCLPGVDGHNDIIKRFDNDNLPVIMAIESVHPPINYLAKRTIDSSELRGTLTKFLSFNEAGFKWKALKDLKNVNILVSTTNNSHCDSCNLFPLTKPSKIEALLPSMLQADSELEQLSFEYKGAVRMVRMNRIKAECREFIEDEDDLSEDDLEPLIQAAKLEAPSLRQRLQDKCSNQVLSEKRHFAEMVTGLARETEEEESVIKTSLEAIKVFKIYPAYEDGTLPPPKVVNTFVGTQTKGDVKNFKYDVLSLYGLVDGIY